ncbi:MAG: CHAT domain-containing protein [Chloroflexi bacterium]|nr:CHAT domain-containing protein [Chloroflexota bacterium]
MVNRTTTKGFIDLEIRIHPRRDDAYLIEIVIGGQRHFRGHLSTDILSWSPIVDPVRDGQELFEALFEDKVLRQAWAEARGQSAQRRIRLHIDASAPELHALPWELLHEGDTMLSANADTPFSRYLAVSEPWDSAVEERPIRVLAVLSNPEDLEDMYNLAPLDTDVERAILEKALFALDEDAIELDFLDPPMTLERIEEALQGGYHILHYVGHGVFNKRREQAALYLQDEEGDAEIVRDKAFIKMLARQSQDKRPRLIFLAACQSTTRSTANAFLGLAPRLVAAGVPAVVAMQDFVAIKTARKLSLAFYWRLAEHGMVDCAMNEARSTLLTTGQPDAAVPVLFMRLQSGQLWGCESEEKVECEATEPQIPPPPQPTAPPEATDFVGREAELAYFAEKLTSFRRVVITGMAGVGKTTLTSVLIHQAADPDHVFWHTFHDGEGIDTIIWKLAGFLFWRGREDLWRMLQGAQQTGGQPPPTEVLFDYLVQMLRGQTHTLCFDDFQVIDDDPDDDPLLAQLVEQLYQTATTGDLSLVIISQHLPSFVGGDEFEVLTGLSLEDTLEFFARHGLPVSQTQAMRAQMYASAELLSMQDLMSAGIIANLHARTEGNAQLLTLAVDAFKRTATPLRLLTRMFEDDNIERFLVKEVDDNLTEDEQAVMSAVAVLLGHVGTRDAIEAILDGQNVRRTLNSLSQRHLLNVAAGKAGRTYNMNTVVRHFYYDLPSKQERQAMHRRAGEYYETEEPDTLKAARHWECAGEYSRAIQLTTDNVRAIINQGQARTLRLLLERFTPQQIDPEQWARVNLALGQTYALLGDGKAAQASYQETLSNLAAVHDSSKARALKVSVCRWLAELYNQRGEYPLARAQVQEGLDALGEQESTEAAELMLIAADVYLRQGDHESALAQGENSLRLGQKHEQTTILAQAHNVLGLINRRREANTASIEHYQQSLKLYQQAGDLIGTAKSYNLIGSAYLYRSQWSEAEHYYRQAYEIFDRLGDAYWCSGLNNNLGLIAMRQGRLDEALTRYQSGLASLEETNGSLYLQSIFHASLGDTFIRCGDVDAACKHLQTSLEYCEQIQARDFLPELHRLQAEAALLANELAQAETYAQQSLNLARELNARAEEGHTLRVLGEIATAREQFNQAEEYLSESLPILKEMKNEYEWARSQLALAKLYGPQKKQKAALAALEECLPIFEQLGAELDLTAARTLKKR